MRLHSSQVFNVDIYLYRGFILTVGITFYARKEYLGLAHCKNLSC